MLTLRPQITQKIKARVKLLNYKPNRVSGVDDGSYSVYSLIGQSKVNKPYVFELTFVSDKSINIEDISDTDVHVILEDMVDNRGIEAGKVYVTKDNEKIIINIYIKMINTTEIVKLGLINAGSTVDLTSTIQFKEI